MSRAFLSADPFPGSLIRMKSSPGAGAREAEKGEAIGRLFHVHSFQRSLGEEGRGAEGRKTSKKGQDEKAF